jgi:DNA-binding CsgD family transcriptional regulator
MALPVRVELSAAEVTEHGSSATQALLQQVIEYILAGSAGASPRVLRRTTELIEQVVFETEVAGVQYYLVRSIPLQTSHVNLSPRELAIARLIAKGLPNKCIGDILEISPWTVATLLRRIFVKLEVSSRAAMVARLGEENIL